MRARLKVSFGLWTGHAAAAIGRCFQLLMAADQMAGRFSPALLAQSSAVRTVQIFNLARLVRLWRGALERFV
jgi:hypothetical protein